jgi:uncharacterized protein YggU (UPF0235/DUF167 family)
MEYIKVRVFTNAKKVRVVKKSNDAFIVYVHEKPELGMANDAVLALLAQELNIHTHCLRIARGAKSPHKLIEIVRPK